jgi:ribosome-associated translation inhibitor RaiA
MLYQISGKQIDIGAALQTHVKSVVDAIASKYAERPTDASGRIFAKL